MESDSDIAIVGMACRFPGADNPGEFWQNLMGGVESISRLTDREMFEAGVAPEVLNRPDYVKAAPVLKDPALFDPGFFGIHAAEADAMDPQHRLLLELAHEALEDAECDPDHFQGRIGVFAGAAMNTYFTSSGLHHGLSEDYIPTLILNDKDFLSTRISYKLGLSGPSMTVQTACSTSLVAVHLARQSLLNEETDMALAGAVSVRVPHRAGYFYDGGGVVSSDGHVRAFDARANGTVFGSGAGVIVMRRFEDALAQGDSIYAVIKGSAVNNDGSGKAGYTAPSVHGQADVVVEALANAGVDAESVSYIETHGSGTPVGDPIEILALTKAFRSFTRRNGFCAIGSVKTNLGHLDAAAGIAGLIKTVLALRHRHIPPSLHYSKPNPEIDFPATPFYVNTAPTQWPFGRSPRRAGVMATGMGGTNAFVILDEPPASGPQAPSLGPHLLLISAKTPTALDLTSRNLADYLTSHSSFPGPAKPSGADRPASSVGESNASEPNFGFLADIAYTLQTGRRHFSCRRFVVCSHTEAAVVALKTQGSQTTASMTVPGKSGRPVVFLFPGIGDHYVGMGQGLYDNASAFRQEVDRCAEILRPLLDLDIRKLLYPDHRPQEDAAKSPGIDLKRMMNRARDSLADPSAQRLDQTRYGHPALFTVEYALAKLWQHLGVQPARLLGHSMGEYVAACLAGVFSLEDALRLIAVRARLVNDLPLGSMTAVMLPEQELIPLLDDDLAISLINGPSLCVVAGPLPAMAGFQDRLKDRQIVFRPVRNAHAFHTPMVDPIADAFARELKRVHLSAPAIPFISNVTGTWITAEDACDPLYWVDHARRPARFNDALEQLWKIPDCLPLEIGPGRTLGVLAMQHPLRAAVPNPVVTSSLRHDYENQPDLDFMLNTVGRLWLNGIGLDWRNLDSRPRKRKINLPTYPFERQRCWHQPRATDKAVRLSESATAHKIDLADWFYVPAWDRTHFSRDVVIEAGAGIMWLIIGDQSDVANSFRSALEARGAAVVLAGFGQPYSVTGPGTYRIRPASLDDYVKLLGVLKKSASQALNVVHLGPLSARTQPPKTGLDARGQEAGFYSLLSLAKAIGEVNLASPVRIAVLTNQIHEVTGDEKLNPTMATVLGPCGVIPKEYPNITAFSVDLRAPLMGRLDLSGIALSLLDEFRRAKKGDVIAYRGRYRWQRTFKPHTLPSPAHAAPDLNFRTRGLRSHGVYLITGGTGGIGLAIARHLAETCQARLVLTRKSHFLEKALWRHRLDSGDLSNEDQRIVSALLEIEALGSEVDVFACEASDRAGMHRVIAESIAKHQAINGVIHAAGIVRAGLIQAKTEESISGVMAPKLDGALILYDLLKDCEVDFLVLFSSIASVLTPYAEADYSAANAFLDAFSYYANSTGRLRTLTINWPGWREIGQLANLKSQAGMERWKADALEKAISTRDGLEAFRRVLISDLPQVIVSPRSLEVLRAESDQPVLQPPVSSRRDPGLIPAEHQGIVDGPKNEVERVVAGIWSNVFGISPVGVNDNFLDLGGHSLIAVQIVSRVRAFFRINFTLRNFFEGPTVAQMSQVIQAGIVSEIESMSDDEVKRLIAEPASR